jgi:hypothetical protein
MSTALFLVFGFATKIFVIMLVGCLMLYKIDAGWVVVYVTCCIDGSVYWKTDWYVPVETGKSI